MFVRAFQAAASAAIAGIAAAAFLAPVLTAAPAVAADILVPGGPPTVFYLCAPPPSAIATHELAPNYKAWASRGDYPRIVDVERYDPHHPPRTVVPKYVVPETAYLASPLCTFPDGVSARSWYDGKLFYIQGGARSSPDTFMVIERR
jgi:hypothetical protein